MGSTQSTWGRFGGSMALRVAIPAKKRRVLEEMLLISMSQTKYRDLDTDEPLPYSSCVVNLVKQAEKRRKSLGHPFISTYHILLVLVEESLTSSLNNEGTSLTKNTVNRVKHTKVSWFIIDETGKIVSKLLKFLEIDVFLLKSTIFQLIGKRPLRLLKTLEKENLSSKRRKAWNIVSLEKYGENLTKKAKNGNSP